MSNENELDIWRCGLDSDQIFEKPCPLTWERLRPTDSPSIRHCETCERNVYEIRTPEAFVQRAKSRDCVAIHPSLTHKIGPPIMMGQLRPWEWNLEEYALQWWVEVGRGASQEFGHLIFEESERREYLLTISEILAREANESEDGSDVN